MRIALRSSLLSLAFLAALSVPANALEIFGNPGLGNGYRTLGPDDYKSLAQGFKMGTTAYDLAAVDVGLVFFGTPLPTSTQLLIGLYNDSSGNPGSLIASFDTGSPSPGFATGAAKVYRFQYTGTGSQKTLAANANYWLVVQSSNVAVNPLFGWNYAQGETTPPAGMNSSNVTYVAARGIVSSGSSWGSIPNTGLRIGVIAVPEPSTYALGIAGTLVMGAIARRKSRKLGSA